MSNKKLAQGVAVMLVPIAMLAIAASVLGTDKEPVCLDGPEDMLVVPLTSKSDVGTSKTLAKPVADQVVARAASSCGAVGAALARKDVESNLVVEFEELTPDARLAPNRKPYVDPMRKDATAFYKNKLLEPLARTEGSEGSPFFGTLAKIGSEFEAHDRPAHRTTIVLIGDGIAFERAPSGTMVDFRHREVDSDALEEFLPLLKPLAGSCVMLAGAGAESSLDPQVLRRARSHFDALLDKARIGFEATRSPDLPQRCRSRRKSA